MKLPPGLLRYCLVHPHDAWIMARAGWKLRRRGWWASWPFLPTPDTAYWQFRMTTAFGDADAVGSVQDVLAAAKWSLTQ